MLLARSWRVRGSQGRAQNASEATLDALGSLPGRSWDDLGRSWALPIPETSGRSQDASENARCEFFARPGRTSLPTSSQSEFYAIFRSPRLVAQHLRHARNISFNWVSAEIQHVRLARTRARESIEKTAISASKIDPGRSKTTSERPPNALRSLRCASERPGRTQASRNFRERAHAGAFERSFEPPETRKYARCSEGSEH